MRNVFYAATAAIAYAALASSAGAETLDNAKVLELVRAELGDEVVIAKIKDSANQFKTSSDDLVALKNAGISSPVIAAMIEASRGASVSANAALSGDSPDPRAPHPSGIYLLADWVPEPKMLVINPTTSNQTKTGGFLGYALTGGIASMSFKTIVPNAQARIVSDKARPRFYFYFDQAARSLSGGGISGIWTAGAVTSPSEFSLARFKVKDDRREAKVGKFNISGAKAGIMDEERIPFSYNPVSPGVFEVTPDLELPPGEYGFVYSMSTGSGPGIAGVGAMTSRIFDFSVKGAPPAKKRTR